MKAATPTPEGVTHNPGRAVKTSTLNFKDGLAQKARLNGDWLIPLPKAFTAAQAMAIGAVRHACLPGSYAGA